MVLRSLFRWLRHRRPFSVPLYLVLVVPFVLQTVGVVALVGYLSYRSGQKTTMALADRLMDETSDRIVEKLQTYLQAPALINRLSVDAVHQKRLDLQNTSALESFIFQRLQNFDRVTAILFANPEGVFRGVEQSPALNLIVTNPDQLSKTFVYRLDSQGKRGPQVNTLSGIDVRRDRPWYKRAVQTGKPGWNPIFQHGPYQALVLNTSQPVYDQTTNRLLGVFSVHMRLDYLSKFLHGLALRHQGQIIILDQDGKLIATSTQESPYEIQSEVGYRSQFKHLSIQESRNELTRSLGKYLRNQGNPHTRSELYNTLQYKGERQFVQVVPFQDPDGLKWQILIVMPESAFMVDVQQNLETTVLLCLLALGGTIALGAAIANRIAVHIKRLNRASQQVTAGDLTQQLPVDSPIAEVKGLAQSFNQMASQLEQSFTNLERALEESEEKFTTVFRTSPDPIGIFSLAEERILEANRSLIEFFGYPREDFIGRTATELLLWHDSSERQRYREQLQQHGKVQNVEITCRTRSGELKTGLISAELKLLEGQLCAVAALKDISDRKAAETAMRQSEERYRFLVEATPHLIWTADAQGRSTYANQRACDYIGLPLEQLLDLDWLTVIHPDDVERVHRCWLESTQTGTLYETEYRIRRSDGVYRWHLERALPYRDEQGQILQWFGMSTDIDDRKAAELALNESEERLRLALDAARMGNWDWNIMTNQIIWSESLERLMGLQPGTFDGRFETVAAMLHPDDRARVLAAITRSVEQGDEYNVEFRFVKPDGSIRWAAGKGDVFRDRSGRAIRMAGVDVDITDRKQAELALQQALQALTHHVENSSLATIRWDQEFRMEVWSKQAEEIFGWTAEEVFGRTMYEWKFIFEDDLEQVNQHVAQLLQGNSGVCHNRNYHKDGSIVYCEWYNSALLDEQGKLVSILSLVQDVSERHRMEAERLQFQLVLQEKEASYRQLFESNPHPMWVYDLETLQFLAVNAAAVAKYGYSETEFLSMTIADIRPPEEVPRLLENLASTTDGLDFAGIWQHQLKDGRLILVEIVSHTLEFSGRQAELVLANDITDRKLAELALQQSEAKFRDIAAVSPVVIFILAVSPEGSPYFEYLSPAAEEVHEIPVADLLANGQLIWDQFHPDDLAGYLQASKRSLETTTLFQYEWRIITPSGKTKWLSATSRPRWREATDEFLWYGITKDVSDRKQAEVALRQSEARFQEISDASPANIHILVRRANGTFYFEHVSQAVETFHGISVEQVLEDANVLLNLIHPEDRADFQTAFKHSRQTLQPFQHEWRVINPSGEIRWLQIHSSPVPRDRGEIAWYGVVEDITNRKLGELALAQESQRRQILFDTSFDGIVILDQGGNVIEANASFANMLGYSLAEVATLNLVDFDAHWTQDKLEQKIEEADFCTNTFETRHRRKDGSIYDVEISSNSVEWNGQFVQFCICRDISDRKAAEAALRHSQTALAEAQQIAHLGNWELHLPAQKIVWSEELFCMFGLDPSQSEPSYADYLQHHIHPDDRAALQRCVEQAIATQTGYIFDYRAILPDGSIRHHEGRGNVELDAQGQVIRLFGTALDITDRKRVENALRESEVRFRSVFEQAAVGLEYTDLTGRCLLVNSTLVELLGYSEEELLSLRLQDITHPEDLAENQMYFQQLLADEIASYCLETRLIHKNRSQIWVNITVSLIRDAMGQPQLMLAVVEDIRDRKQTALELQQAKEAAEAANLAKSAFLANMSHELRTPLNVILGYVQLLSYDASLIQEYQEYLRSIHRSGNHLLALINDVLDLSKIEAGRLTLDESCFDLPNLMQTLWEMFRLRAETKGLDLILVLGEVPSLIRTDQNKLRQIIINLLNNAVKFTESGTITLRIQIDPKSQALVREDRSSRAAISSSLILQVEVEDTGVGIASNELEMIFEAFSQASAGRYSTEGTGLGLTISQKFVQLLGGQLSVDSTPGQGSRFSFWVPVKWVAPTEEQLPVPNHPVVGLKSGQPKYRMLVVDDQPDNRKLLANFLQKVGLEVQEASSGAEAIQQWQTWHPHLIWMDLRMTGMTGYEAMQQIRAYEREGREELTFAESISLGEGMREGEEEKGLLPRETPGEQSVELSVKRRADSLPSPHFSIPIIAITAQAYQEDRERALAAGFTDFITKPFDAATIFQQLGTHLGLQYQYAEPTSLDSSTMSTEINRVNQQSLTSESLQVMPVEWITALNRAALNCSSKEVEDLIAKIPDQHSSLAQGLKRLIHNFDFEVIMYLSNRN